MRYGTSLWRLPALGVALALPLGLAPACSRDRASSGVTSSPESGPEIVAAASTSESPAASSAAPAPIPAPTRLVLGGAATSTAPAPPPGAAVVGNSCSPGKDSIACTPDATEVLTCASGQWRMLESCRGPGRCTGVGSGLSCDTGVPQPGDSCVPATAQPVCRTAHEALLCQGGKWMVSPCAPGHMCASGGPRGQAGCK